jgi:hypothetical protein
MAAFGPFSMEKLSVLEHTLLQRTNQLAGFPFSTFFAKVEKGSASTVKHQVVRSHPDSDLSSYFLVVGNVEYLGHCGCIWQQFTIMLFMGGEELYE